MSMFMTKIFLLTFFSFCLALKANSFSIQDWQKKRREISKTIDKKEVMGILMEFEGRVVSAKKGHFFPHKGYKVFEGDTLSTGDKSYAYLLLRDGMILFLAPKSSVSFKEISQEEERFFFHLRENYGAIYFLENKRDVKLSLDLFPTDIVTDLIYQKYFSFLGQYSFQFKRDLRQGDLQISFMNQIVKEKIQREEEIFFPKKGYYFLVLPQITFEGYLKESMFISKSNSEAYFWHREIESSSFVYLRGHQGAKKIQVKDSSWYQVARDGRNIRINERLDFLYWKQLYQFKRPYYSFLLREKYLSLLTEISKVGLNDIEERLMFLREYEQRSETTLLSQSHVFYESTKEKEKHFWKNQDHNYFWKNFIKYISFKRPLP